MDYRIRLAGVPDAQAIADINVRAWRVGYRGLLPDALLDGMSVDDRTQAVRAYLSHPATPAHQAVVAESEAEVVGYAVFGPDREEPEAQRCGEVYAIYVSPEHWRGGLGRALMDEAIGRLAAGGFTQARLWVLEGNAAARRFYERSGFVADGALKRERIAAFDLHEVSYRRALP